MNLSFVDYEIQDRITLECKERSNSLSAGKISTVDVFMAVGLPKDEGESVKFGIAPSYGPCVEILVLPETCVDTPIRFLLELPSCHEYSTCC
jgi:hypothetical protein